MGGESGVRGRGGTGAGRQGEGGGGVCEWEWEGGGDKQAAVLKQKPWTGGYISIVLQQKLWTSAYFLLFFVSKQLVFNVFTIILKRFCFKTNTFQAFAGHGMQRKSIGRQPIFAIKQTLVC